MSNNHSVKNYQNEEVIKKMYEKSFSCNPENIKISKLSGGLKNAVYLIDDQDKKIVLKIAPLDESAMITVDRGIFWWEAKMLEYLAEISFPSPRLLCYDDSCTICPSPFIFMTYIEGENYLENKDKMTPEEISHIEEEIGILSKRICSIKREEFFLPYNPSKKFNNNYEFVNYLFELLLDNAITSGVELSQEVYSIIRKILKSKKDSLNNISNLCLCHTDIWDGNIMIKNGKISGIVDFSDLYCCDELMTFYFHTIDGITSSSFLKGYNKELNYDEKVRIEIYRMYVILKMIVDCSLKKYGHFDWMYENLASKIKKLTS